MQPSRVVTRKAVDPYETNAPSLVGDVVADPRAWGDPDSIDVALAELRHTEPVCWVEAEGHTPFWLVTRHADVVAVERDPETFTNHPRTVLQTTDLDERLNRGAKLRTLVHMDGEEHRAHRAVTADWFKPPSLAEIEDEISRLARVAVDELVALGGECDFASEIGLRYPLRVILSILGLPEEDYGRMLRLTQETFGAEDPDHQRTTDAAAAYRETFRDYFEYFGALTEGRRGCPAADLSSVIANADIGTYERLSYYILIATAGHDTTSYTAAGGMLALLENPEQLALLRREPELMPGAVEEMLRWATPVRHFMRTAQADAEIGGFPIAKGEAVMLSYRSANRDETVFEDPFAFDITRQPNKHRAFGYGPHTCLGANLARLELRVLFAELLSRLDVELAGEPAWAQSVIVGGVKRLPIRYTVRDAA